MSPKSDTSLTTSTFSEPTSQWDRLVRDPSVDVAKLQALFELYERDQARQAKVAFEAAFNEMQGELPTIAEEGAAMMNNQPRYKYARQEDIIEIVRPILKRHGFSLRFRHQYHEGIVKVIGILSHRAGHSEQDEFECSADSSGSKNPIQAVGSTRTYGQRYTTRALLNIVSRDPNDPLRDTDAHIEREERPRAQPSAPVKMPVNGGQKTPDPTPHDQATITEMQRRKLFAVTRRAGWKDEDVKNWLREVYDLDSTTKIPKAKFDEILAKFTEPSEVTE